MSTSTYTVKPGDNLSTIAKRLGVSVAELKKSNNIKDTNKLSIGQRLTISQKAPTDKPANHFDSAHSDISDFKSYKIQPGDTVSQIAQKYGVSIAQIKAANPGLNIDKIKLGQKLSIPVSNETKKSQTSPETEPQQNKQADIVNKALTDAIAAANADKEYTPLPIHLLGSSEVLKAFLSAKSATTEQLKSSQRIEDKPTVAQIQQTDKTEPTTKIATTETQQPPRNEGEIKQKALKLAYTHAMKKENYRENKYKCASGYWTIGYGHKIKANEKFTKLSKNEAQKLLQKDLKTFYETLTAELGDAAKNLNEHQLAALTNLAFNSGLSAVTNSRYFKLIKEGKLDEAQANMDAVYGNKTRNGRIVRDKNGTPVKEIKNGLLIRRVEEMLMFGNGTLCKKAQERILALLNLSFKTNFKSLDEAKSKMTRTLNLLELKEQKARPKLTQSERQQLNKFRNITELFHVLASAKISISL